MVKTLTAQARPKVLFVGAGALALGCLPQLQHCDCYAIARSPKAVPQGVTFWQGDIASAAMAAQIGQQQWQVIVITLTPENSSPQAYHSAYWLNVQLIVQALAPQNHPFIIFASSTRVYGENRGEWVDEATLAQPKDEQARILLATEHWLAANVPASCAIRFSGIYGPGRDYLLRQVLAGEGGDTQYTNRIHQVDACGVIVFVISRVLKGLPVPNTLLASDIQPFTSADIRRAIADFLGLPASHLKPSQGLRGGNKRCCVNRLQQLGFCWQYPNSLMGYAESVQAYLAQRGQ